MITIDGVEMVDVHEASRLAGRTPETVRRWVWSGRLKAVKQGNKYFVRTSDLPGTSAQPAQPTRGGPMDLAAWVALRDARLPRRHGSGSAADLVLEDRDERARR